MGVAAGKGARTGAGGVEGEEGISARLELKVNLKSSPKPEILAR
jgi:hypothetical protein